MHCLHSVGQAWLGVLFILMVSGCATTPGVPPEEKAGVYQRFAEDPFVPINLSLNPGDFVYEHQANMLRYLADEVVRSDAFVQVSRVSGRWPFSLDVVYSVKGAESGASEVAKGVIAGGTLGLIPTSIKRLHTLTVEVFHGVSPVGSLSIEEEANVRFSIYDGYDVAKGESAVIDRLLMRMVQELDEGKLLPRVSEFQQVAPARGVGEQI